MDNTSKRFSLLKLAGILCFIIFSTSSQAGFLDKLDKKVRKAKEIERQIKRTPQDRLTQRFPIVQNPTLQKLSQSFEFLDKNKVTLYTINPCADCDQARGFLNERDIPFVEKNLVKEQQFQKEYDIIKGRGLPLLMTEINRLDGFEREMAITLVNEFNARNNQVVEPIVIASEYPTAQNIPENQSEVGSFEKKPGLDSYSSLGIEKVDQVYEAIEDRLFYGFYQEDDDQVTHDPMMGILAVFIPANEENFQAKFQFAYHGCHDGKDYGMVNGTRVEAKIDGTWTGTVDNAGVGGTFSGQFANSGNALFGTYTNTKGDQLVPKNANFNSDCRYTVSKSGIWRVYNSLDIATPLPITVMDSGYEYSVGTLVNVKGHGYTFWVYDYECVKSNSPIFDCLMWGREMQFGKRVYYGIGGTLPARKLVKNNRYIAVVVGDKFDLYVDQPLFGHTTFVH